VDQKARDMHLQSGAKDTWSYAQEFTREHKAPSPAKQAPKSSPKPTSGAPPPYVDPTDYYALLGIADKVARNWSDQPCFQFMCVFARDLGCECVT
jgi:hypothetical protein